MVALIGDNFAYLSFPQGTAGNVWRHFWLSKLGVCATIGIWWAEIRAAAKHPAVRGTAPYTKHYLVPKVSTVEVEKP